VLHLRAREDEAAGGQEVTVEDLLFQNESGALQLGGKRCRVISDITAGPQPGRPAPELGRRQQPAVAIHRAEAQSAAGRQHAGGFAEEARQVRGTGQAAQQGDRDDSRAGAITQRQGPCGRRGERLRPAPACIEGHGRVEVEAGDPSPALGQSVREMAGTRSHVDP